jgi:hypothetical protein
LVANLIFYLMVKIGMLKDMLEHCWKKKQVLELLLEELTQPLMILQG